MTDRSKLIQRAKFLALFTIVYNFIEGIAAIYFGFEDDSVSLAGFGLDSFVEVFSAMLMYWKISAKIQNPAREKIALRGIGSLLLLLAAATGAGSIYQLVSGNHPTTTVVGIIISLISLSFMFFLWKAKKNVGEALNDKVILGDAYCSLACIQLSFVLFFGSLLFWLMPQSSSVWPNFANSAFSNAWVKMSSEKMVGIA